MFRSTAIAWKPANVEEVLSPNAIADLLLWGTASRYAWIAQKMGYVWLDRERIPDSGTEPAGWFKPESESGDGGYTDPRAYSLENLYQRYDSETGTWQTNRFAYENALAPFNYLLAQKGGKWWKPLSLLQWFNENYGTAFVDSLHYIRWLYGGGDVVQSPMHGPLFRPPAGRSITSFVNQPLSYEGDDSWWETLIPAIIIGVATAGIMGYLPGTESAFASATTSTVSGAELAAIVESGTVGIEGAFLETAALTGSEVTFATATGELLSMTTPIGEVVAFESFDPVNSITDILNNIADVAESADAANVADVVDVLPESDVSDIIAEVTDTLPESDVFDIVDTLPDTDITDIITEVTDTLPDLDIVIDPVDIGPAVNIPGTNIPMPSVQQILNSGKTLLSYAQQITGQSSPRAGIPIALNNGRPVDAYGNFVQSGNLNPALIIAGIGAALLLTS
jgi:hypothetical protein